MNDERLQAGQPREGHRRVSRKRTWAEAFHRLRNRRNVIGRGPAAAADDVHEAALGELADQGPGFFRELVVLAERVGKPRVRVAADVALGDAREIGEIGPHVARAEGAVDADAERPRVANGNIERVECLS